MVANVLVSNRDIYTNIVVGLTTLAVLDIVFIFDASMEHGHSMDQRNRSSLNMEAPNIQSKIAKLNKSIPQGESAEVDAFMFVERKPITEIRPFLHLYGLEPVSAVWNIPNELQLTTLTKTPRVTPCAC